MIVTESTKRWARRGLWMCGVAAALASGCSDESTGLDAGDPADAGSVTDVGASPDGGSPPIDAGGPDTGSAGPDATAPDATAPDATAPDATTPDAATPDAGPGPDGGPTGPRELPTPPDLGRIDLGTKTILGPAGISDEIRFTIPDGTQSFMIVLKGAEPHTYIVQKLVGPGGVTLVSDDASGVTGLEKLILGPFAAQFKGPNRVVQDDGMAAATFPNNPAVTVVPGEYVMHLAGVTVDANGQGVAYAGPVDVVIYTRSAVLDAARIDVHLYFTGAGGLSAAAAEASPLIQDALTEVQNIYGQANLTIGSVTYTDIDPAFSTIDSFTGALAELNEMFKTSAANGSGLHYFFVDRFEGGLIGGGVGGIAGGLPGPPLHPGSVASGVAVSLTAANGDPKILAHVMAHEGGHWLGLFHTSEFTGTADQMPDTPEGQQGNLHLMYPTVGGGTNISVEQAKVMRRHAEVRP